MQHIALPGTCPCIWLWYIYESSVLAAINKLDIVILNRVKQRECVPGSEFIGQVCVSNVFVAFIQTQYSFYCELLHSNERHNVPQLNKTQTQPTTFVTYKALIPLEDIAILHGQK